MKKIILSIMILSFSFSLFARLGETLDQCKKRYGVPVKAKSQEVYFFSKGDFLMKLEFLKNSKTCNAISYIKVIQHQLNSKPAIYNQIIAFFFSNFNKNRGMLSKIEIDYFKQIYSEKPWTKMPLGEVAIDSLVCFINYNGTLIFYDKNYSEFMLDLLKKIQKALKTQTLKGF